jgi:hypothetical protein
VILEVVHYSLFAIVDITTNINNFYEKRTVIKTYKNYIFERYISFIWKLYMEEK